MKKRKCSINRCTLFNCNESLNKWTCCKYCGKWDKCEVRCYNDPKKCGYFKCMPDPCYWQTRGMREGANSEI